MKDAFTGQNLDAFKFSVKLSALAAAFGVVVGAFLAYAAASIRRPKWLRSLVIAFSGVAANLGGVPLAFAFIALLGRQGLMTKILEGLGYDLYGNGFQLDTTTGFVAVYSYFNIPLMVLITLPAIDGLKVVVARGVRQPRRHDVHVLAADRPAGPRCRRCSAGSCCCSPTRSAPTRRRGR